MKCTIIFAILAVMLLAGCAQQTQENPVPTITPHPETPTTPDVTAPETPTTPETTAPETPNPTTQTIILSDNAAEPATLTVAAGSTITFKNTGTKIRILQIKATEFSDVSPKITQGNSWSITLDQAGEYTFVDIIFGKPTGTITVK